jgi:hypothetical protein
MTFLNYTTFKNESQRFCKILLINLDCGSPLDISSTVYSVCDNFKNQSSLSGNVIFSIFSMVPDNFDAKLEASQITGTPRIAACTAGPLL